MFGCKVSSSAGVPVQGGYQLLHVCRQRRFPAHRPAIARVNQTEPGGMQGLASELMQGLHQRGTGPFRMPCAAAVERIADQGVPEVRHVDADLMRAPGLQFHSQECMGTKLPFHAIVADGRLATSAHRHACANLGMSADGRIDGSAGNDDPLDQRQVFTRQGPFLQLVNQVTPGPFGLGHDQQPGSFLVQTMYDTGPRQLSQFRRMVQQGIQQCPFRIAGSRMNDQSSRLVDDQYLVILVHDGQRDILRPPVAGRAFRNAHVHLFAAVQLVAGARRQTIDHDPAFTNPLLKLRARMLGQKPGQGLVQSPGGFRRRYGQANRWSIHPSRFPSFNAFATRRVQVILLRLVLSIPAVSCMPSRRLPAVILVLLVVAGCASLDDDPTKGWSAQRLYTEGKTALANKNYTEAIGLFEKIEARYPYGPYAEQSMLETAYAYYKSDEMAPAIAAADRFLRTHPTHPHVDYAYYLKGLASFDEERSTLEKFFGAGDPSKRDTKSLRDAYDAFREVVTRFPQSRYAEDCRKRLVSLQNAMAMSEIHAARYYYSRGAYVATINRAKVVIEEHQRTPAVEDALGLEMLSYRALGLDTLMRDSRRVLEMNFPNSHYLKESSPVPGATD